MQINQRYSHHIFGNALLDILSLRLIVEINGLLTDVHI